MKSERRHELQTNTLADSLAHLPDFWNKHGTKILMVLVAIALFVVLLRYRISSARQATISAGDELATARQLVGEIGTLYRPDVEAYATARTQYITDATAAIDHVLATADDPKVIAEATLARGDLNWVLANQPKLPGATTRESLNLKDDSATYLTKAEEAYQQILKSYPQQKNTVVAAKFGLAAIAENRANWDEAAKQYDSIVNDKDAVKVFQDQARARQETLKDIKQPVYIAGPSTASSMTRNFVEVEPTTAPTTTPGE